jgi:phosphoribosylglycinamide formyltransferase 1
MYERSRIVVLISGRGSNMSALLDSTQVHCVADVVGVVSNQPTAAGLGIAMARSIETAVVNHKDFESRDAFDEALSAALEALRPDLLVLAGFMRILTPAFTARWQGQMLNIHPSLLPAYPGLHTHARALADGVCEHGATVHFVTSELDGGPAILQARVPVRAHDDETTLAARVLEREHEILPLATNWFATGRLRLLGNQAELDRVVLTAPVPYEESTGATT